MPKMPENRRVATIRFAHPPAAEDADAPPTMGFDRLDTDRLLQLHALYRHVQNRLDRSLTNAVMHVGWHLDEIGAALVARGHPPDPTSPEPPDVRVLLVAPASVVGVVE